MPRTALYEQTRSKSARKRPNETNPPLVGPNAATHEPHHRKRPLWPVALAGRLQRPLRQPRVGVGRDCR